jgi:hypothetical protein
LHWSDKEGRLWNEELRQMTDEDWREMLRAQCAIGINILVIQESFRNEQYVDKHRIEREGYQGLAYYPSALYPGRMAIGSANPIEAILDEADKLGMNVFLPLGLYAWFDFTPGSLEWHRRVADELWSLYGRHASFYGWYVSEEIHGNLGSSERHREELVTFFAQLKAHCQALSPDKPLMLATAYRSLYSVLASYLAARLAPGRPMAHAMTLGVIGFVVSLAGAVLTWNRQPPLGPHWYPVALIVLVLPLAWVAASCVPAKRTVVSPPATFVALISS